VQEAVAKGAPGKRRRAGAARGNTSANRARLTGCRCPACSLRNARAQRGLIAANSAGAAVLL